MADNVNYTESGTTAFATDQVGDSSHYQKIKIADGAADSTAMIGGDATNGLDVDVTRVGGNVTVIQGTATSLKCEAAIASSQTIAVTQGTAAQLNCTEASASDIKTSVQLIDDAVATTGSAITAKGLAACGTDGTNARVLKTDTSGELQVDVLSGPTGTSALQHQGAIAHDSPESTAYPVYLGASATSGLSGITLVANDDVTHVHAGLDGVVIVRPHAPLEDIVSGNGTTTDGSAVTGIASSGSGVKTYLCGFTLVNTSATFTYCEIKDGSTTKLTVPLPPYGGVVCNLTVPIPGTANTIWYLDPAASINAFFGSAYGFKSKE